MSIEQVGLLLASYLAGSIPFGLIFTRIIAEKDIREIGSKNIGTANVLRNAGVFAGVLTFICDVLKGLLPTLLAMKFFGLNYAVAVGLLCFSGHIFPIFLRFKGGKGVATAFGTMLALNYISALIAFGIFLVVIIIFRISSLSSLAAAVAVPIVNLAMHTDSRIVSLSILLTIIIFIAHRANIQRLIKGEEPQMWSKI